MAELVLRSVIRSSFIEKHLLKGSCIALVGVLTLFIAYYSYTPLIQTFSQLFLWIGIALIAAGLIPYKKLSKLEIDPYVLYADTTELSLMTRQKCLLKIPLILIQHVSHVETSNIFGMALHLHSQSAIVLPKEVVRATKKAKKEFSKSLHTDSTILVLPYFTETSTAQFSDHLITARE